MASIPLISSINSLPGGLVSHARASARTIETVYGIEEIAPGEVGFNGGRRERNLFADDTSEDFTSVEWVASSGAVKVGEVVIDGVTAMELSFGQTFSDLLQTVSVASAGVDYRPGIYVRAVLGSTSVRLRGGPDVTGNITIDNAQWWYLEGDIYTTPDTTSRVFGVRSQSGTPSGNIYIAHAGLYNVTGRSNQTIPERVSTHTDYGAGVKGVCNYTKTNGNTVDVNGVVTEGVGNALDVKGAAVNPAGTNKCTNYNAVIDSGAITLTDAASFNSSAPFNVAAVDGGTGTLFGVLDKTSLVDAAGLLSEASGGLMLWIDNTSGTAQSLFSFGGTTGGTSAKAISGDVVAETGAVGIRVSGGGGGNGSATTTSNSIVRLESVATAPASSGSVLQFFVAAGSAGGILFNQLEDGSVVTSRIVTEGAAATRNADEIDAEWVQGLVNNLTLSLDFTGRIVNGRRIFSIGTSTDNWEAFLLAGGEVRVSKRVGGVIAGAFNSAISLSDGVTTTLEFTLDVNGMSVAFDGVKDANSNVDTADLSFDTVTSALKLGRDINGGNVIVGSIRNLAYRPLRQGGGGFMSNMGELG